MARFQNILAYWVLGAILIFQWAYLSVIGVYLNYAVLGGALIFGLLIRVDRSSTTIPSIFAILYILQNLLMNDGLSGGQTINLVLWIALTPIAVNCHQKLTSKNRRRMLEISLQFALVYLTADTIVRLVFPSPPLETMQFIENSTGADFYAYKFGGFMFSESNSFGVIALSAYFAARIKQRFDRQYLISIAFCALVLLSLSRAAIATMILFEILGKARIGKRAIPFVVFLIYCLVINTLLLVVNAVLPQDFDGSGQSKVKFYLVFIKLIQDFNMEQLLFGIGLGQAVNFSGFYLHNLFILLQLETGFIGTILILFVFWRIFNRESLRPVLLSLPILGLSYLFMLGAPAVFITPLIAALQLEQQQQDDPFGRFLKVC